MESDISMSGDVDADGEEGIDWATERKKSSMYWSDAGSYWRGERQDCSRHRKSES